MSDELDKNEEELAEFNGSSMGEDEDDLLETDDDSTADIEEEVDPLLGAKVVEIEEVEEEVLFGSDEDENFYDHI